MKIKDATPEQLKRGTCVGCGKILTRGRGWLNIVPAWAGRPICGECLDKGK